MIKIDKTHYNVIAKLLADSFLEDELVLMQLRGIENPKLFLEKLFLCQTLDFHKTSEIHALDENLNAVLIGYEKKNYRYIRAILSSIGSQLELQKQVNGNELKVLAENSKQAMKNIDLKWYNSYIKGNYYTIKVIAIAKEERGKGHLRKLMMPIITRCNEKSIPIVLETNTAENVPIYQHFGFELVKTIAGDEADFYQYCFIKHPK